MKGYLLSDKDIKKAMKHRDIIIDGFSEDRLRGAGYGLTFGGKNGIYFSLTYKSLKKLKKDEIDGKQIMVLEPFESIIFWTRERVILQKKYAGIMNMSITPGMSRGFSNLSTTIDPGWVGQLAIRIANNTPHKLVLEEGEPICVVSFFKLSSETNEQLKHCYARGDIYYRI